MRGKLQYRKMFRHTEKFTQFCRFMFLVVNTNMKEINFKYTTVHGCI